MDFVLLSFQQRFAIALNDNYDSYSSIFTSSRGVVRYRGDPEKFFGKTLVFRQPPTKRKGDFYN